MKRAFVASVEPKRGKRIIRMSTSSMEMTLRGKLSQIDYATNMPDDVRVLRIDGPRTHEGIVDILCDSVAWPGNPEGATIPWFDPVYRRKRARVGRAPTKEPAPG